LSQFGVVRTEGARRFGDTDTIVGEIVAQGLVASGAGCEGIARRASAVADVLALLQAPDLDETILLTESATATTIIPLLGGVRGLICTSGGVTSHVAILSREFGLCCVMGAELEDLAVLDGARVVIEADGTIARA
jgi:phosphoenolpyruvate-protein kinase (PTS system EI component)